MPCFGRSLFIKMGRGRAGTFSEKLLFAFTSHQLKCKKASVLVFCFTYFERYVEKYRPFKKEHDIVFEF